MLNISIYPLSWKRVEYGELLIMPANGRWDLIRRLKVKQECGKQSDTSNCVLTSMCTLQHMNSRWYTPHNHAVTLDIWAFTHRGTSLFTYLVPYCTYYLICAADCTLRRYNKSLGITVSGCATNRKVACSIPDGFIGIFHWPNPPDRTMALGVYSASNRNGYQEDFLGVNAAGAYGWQPYHLPVRLSWNLGTLTSWNPLGHSRPVTGLLYLYYSVCSLPYCSVRYTINHYVMTKFVCCRK